MVSIIWGHTKYTDKHCRYLEAAQKSALILILRVMKSTPTEELHPKLNIAPIDVRVDELQRIEAIKLLQKNDQWSIKMINDQQPG